MPETLQRADTDYSPEEIHPAVVREMTIYILGAQPQMVAQSFSNDDPPNRDPHDPDNTNPHSWRSVCYELAKDIRTGIRRPIRPEQLVEVAAQASAAAYADALDNGLELPLTPPKEIAARLNQPGWEDLRQWYVSEDNAPVHSE